MKDDSTYKQSCQGYIETKDGNNLDEQKLAPRGKLVLAAGVGSLVFVPIFKTITGLPPYLGMLFGLAALWVLTDALHFGERGRSDLRVPVV